jgi:hypothetical protein
MTRATLTPFDSTPGLAVSSVISAVVVLALGLTLCWLLGGLGGCRAPVPPPPDAGPAVQAAASFATQRNGGAESAPPSGHATEKWIRP